MNQGMTNALPFARAAQGPGRAGRGSGAEDAPLLLGELLVGQQALLAQLPEVLELCDAAVVRIEAVAAGGGVGAAGARSSCCAQRPA